MAKIRCDCGRTFIGMEGKEDTCPRCLAKLINPKLTSKEIEKKLKKMAGF